MSKISFKLIDYQDFMKAANAGRATPHNNFAWITQNEKEGAVLYQAGTIKDDNGIIVVWFPIPHIDFTLVEDKPAEPSQPLTH